MDVFPYVSSLFFVSLPLLLCVCVGRVSLVFCSIAILLQKFFYFCFLVSRNARHCTITYHWKSARPRSASWFSSPEMQGRGAGVTYKRESVKGIVKCIDWNCCSYFSFWPAINLFEFVSVIYSRPTTSTSKCFAIFQFPCDSEWHSYKRIATSFDRISIVLIDF